MATTIQIIISISIALFGIYLILKSKYVSQKLKEFYLKYPLVHYAGDKQLTSKPIYIAVFGIVFIFLGIFGYIGSV